MKKKIPIIPMGTEINWKPTDWLANNLKDKSILDFSIKQFPVQFPMLLKLLKEFKECSNIAISDTETNLNQSQNNSDKILEEILANQHTLIELGLTNIKKKNHCC